MIAAMMLLASQAKADNFYFQALLGKRFLTEADLTLEGTTSKVAIAKGLFLSGSGAFGYRILSFPYEVVDTRIEIEGGVSENTPNTIEPRGPGSKSCPTKDP